MDSGTKVYAAYISSDHALHWIDTGVISEIICNGNPMVRLHESLVPFGGRWRLSRAEAKRDAHAALVRHIGELQAKADRLNDEILHEVLTTEEAAA